MGPLEIVHADSNFVLGTFDRVILQSWKGTVLADEVRRAYELAAAMKARFGMGKTASMAVVNPFASFPDESVRKLGADSITKLGEVHIGSATIIEGSGFVLSAARAAIASIHFLSKTRFPQKVFDTSQHAAEWLCPLLGWSDVAALADAMTELRRRH